MPSVDSTEEHRRAAQDRGIESVVENTDVLLNSNYVQEIICRRFDRLSSQMQTVLKIAATC
jgi:hypothetical protein